MTPPRAAPSRLATTGALLGLLLVPATAPAAAQSRDAPPAQRAATAPAITAAQVEQIDSIFSPWTSADGPGVAVAVTRDGRTVFSRGYGSAQLEHRVPITPSTPFHVASVSKQFTTFAVALLARDGALSWDDELHRHLPELPDLGQPVTLRQLASHTSGVRDQWELLAMAGWRLDDVITRDQVVAMMQRQRELNFEPGSRYLYSNMGYSLLAEVVERVSGLEFGEFLRERVFVPLGMHHTHVHLDHTAVVPGRAYSYRGSPGGEWSNAVLSYANQGATSLFTTAEDLARWIGEMEAPRVGDEELWREMRTRAELRSGDQVSYGLGLSISSHRGLATVGHGGSDAGFRSNLLHFPEERLGVVVLGNASSFNAGGTAQAVAAVFLEERMNPVRAAGGGGGGGQPGGGGGGGTPPEPAGPLSDYEGTYYSPELDTLYRIRLVDDTLRVLHQRHPDGRLAPLSGDRFRGSAWFLRNLEFSRSADGSVDGFRASGSRVLNLRFERIVDPLEGSR